MGRGRGRTPGRADDEMHLSSELENAHRDERLPKDVVMDDRDNSGQKQLNFDNVSTENFVLILTNTKNTVENIVGLFHNAGQGGRVVDGVNTPGKYQAQKRSRTGEDISQNIISATSELEVDREQ
jgi:hypothetical protein